MKATVIVPTYRRSQRLATLLECLTRQEGDALAQVIVCDDGSPDDTAAVARSFVSRLPLDYRFQEDLGFRAGQARNMGIAVARGDILIFLDDDLTVARGFVAAHVEAHRNAPQPSLFLGLRHRTFTPVDHVPTLEEVAAAEPDDRVAALGPHGERLREHATPWMFVYSCNLSVPATAEELHFDDGFLGWGLEDTEFGYRLSRAGLRIQCAPLARALHIEDPTPRDPFRCEETARPPSYDTYVRNAVYFMDKHSDDPAVTEWVRNDLRWYVRDEATGAWVKNGYGNDVEAVIAACRRERNVTAPARNRPSKESLDERHRTQTV